jgi:hypothetical protein
MQTKWLIWLGISITIIGALLDDDEIPDGKARGRKSSEFDPRELDKGTAVEMEHTSSRRLAQKIAMDHLVEDPAYYRKLARIHQD